MNTLDAVVQVVDASYDIVSRNLDVFEESHRWRIQQGGCD